MKDKSYILWLLILLLMIILIVLILINSVPLLVQKIPEENGSINIYFCPRQNCSFYFMQALANSNFAECALYDINLPEVINVLQNKNIDLLVDEDNYYGYGKKIVGYGIMHNKFCVFDTGIITGSFNPTFNDNYKNNNNLLIINSEILRQNYLDEFKELKEGINVKTRKTKVIVNGVLFENYFCPEDNCQAHVLMILNGAQHEIKFMIFSFTDDDIGDLLVRKFNQGILVTGIMEKTQQNDYDEYEKLFSNGINVSWDKNPGKVHHKVFIIDGKIVITGSYNPTKNGNENNDENIVIIHDERIARLYLEEFDYVVNNYS
ncbi:MAG: phospholipase D-like domain-containing protein [Candidatus Woesearchaeota archaeon]